MASKHAPTQSPNSSRSHKSAARHLLCQPSQERSAAGRRGLECRCGQGDARQRMGNMKGLGFRVRWRMGMTRG
jgi:hypothetical protein